MASVSVTVILTSLGYWCLDESSSWGRTSLVWRVWLLGMFIGEECIIDGERVKVEREKEEREICLGQGWEKRINKEGKKRGNVLEEREMWGEFLD